MALLMNVKGISPQFGDDCWLAPNATVVGDVQMGARGSIWFSAVVRGDVNKIRIGDQVNIQDGAVIHCTYEKTEVHIGDRVSIGHNAIVHGCTIHPDVLIGMGAVIMDNCIVESGSIVAAGAVVLEGTHVPAGCIFAGVPAKKVKDISKELFEGEVKRISKNYHLYASWFKDQT